MATVFLIPNGGGARGRETNGRIVWLPIRPPRPLCFVARPTRQGRSSLAFPPATGRVQSQTSTTCAFRRNSARGLGLAGLFLSLSSAAEHRAGRRKRDWAIGSRHHCGWSVMARAAFSSLPLPRGAAAASLCRSPRPFWGRKAVVPRCGFGRRFLPAAPTQPFPLSSLGALCSDRVPASAWCLLLRPTLHSILVGARMNCLNAWHGTEQSPVPVAAEAEHRPFVPLFLVLASVFFLVSLFLFTVFTYGGEYRTRSRD
jgi:hypothetical protein